MSRARKFLVFLLIGGILAMQLGFTIALMKGDGIRVHWPDSKLASARAFEVTGDAWMAPGRGSIAAIEVLASPATAGLSPAEREAGSVRARGALTWVEDRGKPLYPLQFWTAPIELPSAGEWELVATARDASGREIRSKVRRFSADEVPPRAFVPWSGQHLAALAVSAALIAAFGFAAAKGGERFMRRAAPWYTLVLFAQEFAFQTYWFSRDAWSPSTALMLHMCGLAILLLPPVMMMGPSKTRDRLSELLYFWGTGGAVQALIFPDIMAFGFPTFRFFTFFASHALIIAGSLALATSGRARITLAAVGRLFLRTTLLLVPIWAIDHAMAFLPPYAPANYFLMGYPPTMGSVIDVFADAFGPSPRYVLGIELMGVVVFGALWAPWAVARKLREKRGKGAAPRPRSGTAAP